MSKHAKPGRHRPMHAHTHHWHNVALAGTLGIVLCFVGSAVATRMLLAATAASADQTAHAAMQAVAQYTASKAVAQQQMSGGGFNAAARPEIDRTPMDDDDNGGTDQSSTTADYTSDSSDSGQSYAHETATEPDTEEGVNTQQAAAQSGLGLHPLASDPAPTPAVTVIPIPSVAAPVQQVNPTPTVVGSGGISVITSNPISITNPTQSFRPSFTHVFG